MFSSGRKRVKQTKCYYTCRVSGYQGDTLLVAVIDIVDINVVLCQHTRFLLQRVLMIY